MILNIKAIWQIDGFDAAVNDYKERGGAEADALLNFKDKQSEVILSAPLLLSEIETFCGPVGTFDQLFAEAGVAGEQQEDEFVQLLKKIDRFPGDAFWLPREASQRVIRMTLEKFSKKFEALRSR